MEVALTVAATAAALWTGYRIARAMTRHLGEPEPGGEGDDRHGGAW